MDETAPQSYAPRTTDLCAGWHPTNAIPPWGVTAFNVYGDRQGHTLRLRDSAGGSWPIPTNNSQQQPV